MQFGTAVCVSESFDSEPDFGQRHSADEETVEWLFGDKCNHLAMRSRSPYLGDDVRVEQPAGHNATSRTRIRDRDGSMFVDR